MTNLTTLESKALEMKAEENKIKFFNVYFSGPDGAPKVLPICLRANSDFDTVYDFVQFYSCD